MILCLLLQTVGALTGVAQGFTERALPAASEVVGAAAGSGALAATRLNAAHAGMLLESQTMPGWLLAVKQSMPATKSVSLCPLLPLLPLTPSPPARTPPSRPACSRRHRRGRGGEGTAGRHGRCPAGGQRHHGRHGHPCSHHRKHGAGGWPAARPGPSTVPATNPRQLAMSKLPAREEPLAGCLCPSSFPCFPCPPCIPAPLGADCRGRGILPALLSNGCRPAGGARHADGEPGSCTAFPAGSGWHHSFSSV